MEKMLMADNEEYKMCMYTYYYRVVVTKYFSAINLNFLGHNFFCKIMEELLNNFLLNFITKSIPIYFFLHNFHPQHTKKFHVRNAYWKLKPNQANLNENRRQ